MTLHAAPWLAFAAVLAWGWRAYDLAHAIPAYSDTMEVLWAAQWFGDALRSGRSPWLYSLIFHPGGWHVATYADGPTMLLALVPAYLLGGAAWANNLVTLLTFVLAFAGFLTLALRYVSRLPATVGALLYTFWGFRWLGIGGHLNILIGTALLPWQLVCIDRALASPQRRAAWLLLAGLLWGLAISSSFYFAFVAGFALLAYVLPRRLQARLLAEALLVPALAAGLVSTPAIFLFLQGSAGPVASYPIQDVNELGASLNEMPLPALWHPVLGNLLRHLYRGSPTEQALVNYGPLTLLAALLGCLSVARLRYWRPVVALALVGSVLALGLTLQWDGRTVAWPWLGPLDGLLWRLGHALKPEFFPGDVPPPPFDSAVPLPGLLLAAVVPFINQARVFARYAYLASAGIFLLAGAGIAHLRRGWLMALAGALLVFEMLPQPSAAYPYPPPPHPAFTWLSQQDLGGQAIIDLYAADRYTLVMPIQGETLYATLYHGQPTTAGTSSVWPAATAYLQDWLSAHPHAFQNPDFAPLLRSYGVKMVALQVRAGYDEQVLGEEAQRSPDFMLRACFDPPPGPGPWNYPICVLEVRPAPPGPFNVLLRSGWSGAESWGRWVEGTEARAEWIVPEPGAARLSVSAFPLCVPGRPQEIAVAVNGRKVHSYRWSACDPWTADLDIPAADVHVGSNELIITAAFADHPATSASSTAQDPRLLSLGITRLTVTAP